MLWKAGYIKDLMTLVFPRNCLACTETLFRHEQFLCNHCYINLPKSNFHLQPDNEIERIFHGRIPLQKGSSYYLFEKSGKVQRLLHHIKYKGNKELAIQLGKWYGSTLLETEFAKSDFIVPVPLHPDKLKQRGFNQSEAFARGLSEAWKINLSVYDLIRTDFTSSQTRKKKFERWENVRDKFVLIHPEKFIGKKNCARG